MRVLGIISSPRKGGNSELAVKEILRTLPDSWEKAMININDLNIKTCKACYGCIPQGAECRVKDDMSFLIDQVRQADKVVVAAPAYMLGGHTMLKRALDRLIGLTSEYPNFGPADCVIVVPYGYYGWEGMSKEDTLLFARKFHCRVVGSEVMLATLPGDSVKGENLEKLHRLADALENGIEGLPKPTSDAFECPFCSGTAFMVRPDGTLQCGICGGQAKLSHGEGGLKLDYDPDFQHRLTHRALDLHAAYLDEKKNLFLSTRKEIQALQASYNECDAWWIKPEKEE